MPSRDDLRIPPWLRTRLPQGGSFTGTDKTLAGLGLNTVCRHAKCPNIWECYSNKVATFMILGAVCTRNCAFCNVSGGSPEPVDPGEPERISRAVGELDLKHVVVTSVTRDDLGDGGAGHFAAVVARVRTDHPGCSVEVLVPDFRGDKSALAVVLDAGPQVLNHNVETAPELYPAIRPQAVYERSLELLRRAKTLKPEVRTKSGLMAGLGETDSQVLAVLSDLATAGCDIATVGQYMRPSPAHPPVARYVRPEMFMEYSAAGENYGIPRVYSGPRVRSSYNARLFAAKERGEERQAAARAVPRGRRR